MNLLLVSMDSVRKVIDPQSISLSVTGPPTFSECIQVPDDCPIWLHILISGDAIVVSTQPSNKVLIGAGQYDLWYTDRGGKLFTNKLKKSSVNESKQRFLLLLPPRLLPSKRTVSPKSVVSWTCLEFIVMLKPSTGMRGGATRSPFT